MGEVYKARDPRLGRTIALKILPAHLADDESRRRFEREARSASALTHPNVVTIHDVGEADGVAFLAMEFIEGRTLRDLTADGPVAVKALLRIAVQVADGLAAAHELRIVHRDLKPENILLTKDGVAKILDFGLAKAVTDSVSVAGTMLHTEAGSVVGTVGYMSPEQVRGGTTDFRSDQFSLGAILYELASGRRAFARSSMFETGSAVLTQDPEPLDRLCPHIPPPLQWAIERCLSKDPHDRYASTRDLHRDLVAVDHHLSNVRAHGGAFPGSTLPSLGTPLIGRDRDVAAITRLVMRDEVRWVTLTGPGGVGKSRLSVQVASELSEPFGGAVCYVPLATIADFRLVPSAIGQALDVRLQGGESPLDALKRHLRMSRAPLLLVVDNFEHVADAAPLITELLESAPALKVLVTSRSVLHVYAEREFPVPPLALPDRRHVARLEALAQCPAVALFVQRATAARPDFTLTAENAPAVVEICTRLDGLPMALELAAARIKMLPPAALLARLEGRLLSLTGGARDLPARQQTLRNAIEWSYGLLTAEEQRVFRRLAVFVNGWTLESAEAVCDAREDLGIDILDGIASLVDKSLAQRVEPVGPDDNEPRFVMLETIREYALERLEGAGETLATRRAHAAYCLVLAEEGSASSEATAQVRWLGQCDVEHGNFRAALQHLTETRHIEWGLRLATALLPFWQSRAHLSEARDFLSALLELPEAAARTELRARATFALGTLADSMGDYAAGHQLHQHVALPIFRELADKRGVAVCLNAIGVSRGLDHDASGAIQAFEECLAIWHELGDEQALARTLSNLANMAATQRDFTRARRLYGECRAMFQRLGDTTGAAWTLNHEGDAVREQGDVEAARALYDDALKRFRGLFDYWGIAGSLTALGRLAADTGQLAAAHEAYREALSVCVRAGDRRGAALLLEAFAGVAAREHDAVRALKLAGAAAALRGVLGVPLAPDERQKLEQTLEPVRLGPQAPEAATAWMEGWSMSFEDAVDYAIGGVTSR
jgi:predicted ATPase